MSNHVQQQWQRQPLACKRDSSVLGTVLTAAVLTSFNPYSPVEGGNPLTVVLWKQEPMCSSLETWWMTTATDQLAIC